MKNLIEKEHQTQVSEAKAAQKIAKYSTDYDKTIVIRWIFGLFGFMMFGMMFLEFWARFVIKTSEVNI